MERSRGRVIAPRLLEHNMASDIPATPREGRRYRVTALVMLLLVYTFNFVDRQILGILAPTIKADLALTDTQLGLLGGLAFALLYSTLAIPLAWLADRTSRTWVITLSLAVWSGFTALCGVASNFAQLFAFRIGVGVGEAGGVAPSYAVIADTFAPDRRARALAVYSLGIPLGSAAGVRRDRWAMGRCWRHFARAPGWTVRCSPKRSRPRSCGGRVRCIGRWCWGSAT